MNHSIRNPGEESTLRVPLRIQSAANLREHWAAKARRVKAERDAVCLTWLAMGNGLVPVLRADQRATVALTRIAPRALDGHDNLRSALKPCVDEIARCLGLTSDADPRVTWLYDQRRGKVREYAVEVLVHVKSKEERHG